MRGRRFPGVVLLVASCAILMELPQTARAEHGVEITPFAGYAFGGGFEDNTTGRRLDAAGSGIIGLVLGLRDTYETQYELFYSFQRTELRGEGIPGGNPLFDLDIHYLHAGGTYLFPGEKVRPFLSGGLGMTLFFPDDAGLSPKANFSLSLGGGLKVPFSGSVGLRIEGRGFLTILPQNSQVYCVSSGGASCAVRVQGDVFGQVELLAGIYFGF